MATWAKICRKRICGSRTCGKHLPDDRAEDALYCDHACRARAHSQRERDKARDFARAMNASFNVATAPGSVFVKDRFPRYRPKKETS